jgi:hypothetical protein
MRRKVASLIVAASSAVVISACAELPVQSPAPDEVNSFEVPAPDLGSLAEGTIAVASFVIDPARTTVYSDGLNKVTIPAGSVCDPAVSTYGPTEWDRPCATITEPLAIDVTLSASDGRLTLAFSPDIRFAPHPNRHVTLEMKVDAITSARELRQFAVFWVPTGEKRLVDEGKTDPSLRTQVFKKEGRLLRRLKHFSGYNVYSGIADDCSPQENPDWCRPLGEVQEQ